MQSEPGEREGVDGIDGGAGNRDGVGAELFEAVVQ